MRFVTWNTQGNFTEGRKSAIVKELYEGTNVLFIQEGGVDKTWGDGLFKTTAGMSVGAKNERCTNYVLISDTTWNAQAQSVVFTTVGGGIAGRKPAAIQVGKMLLVSWHSLASADSSDTKQLLAEAGKKLNDPSLDHVVIGGDFNANPDDIDTMIAVMGSTRQGIGHFACVIAPPRDMPSHDSGRVLDFFVVMSKGSAPSGNVWTADVDPSDHNPVIMDLN